MQLGGRAITGYGLSLAPSLQLMEHLSEFERVAVPRWALMNAPSSLAVCRTYLARVAGEDPITVASIYTGKG